MALEDAGRDDLSSDPAAEAFEALRADVLARLDALAGELKGPDYSPTLGAILLSLQAIERHPALATTPQRFAQDMRLASEAARQQAERELHGATQQLGLAARELKGLLQAARDRRDQVRLVAIAAGASLAAGAVLWAGFSGPLARVLPASWAVPEKMAAATLGEDRWTAGWRLMQTANPAAFRLAVEGDRLAMVNQDALTGCEAAARRSSEAQRCVVVVSPESATTR